MHGAVPAPLGRRVVAYILDCLLLQFIMAAFAMTLFGEQIIAWQQLATSNLAKNIPPPNPDINIIIFGFVIQFLYTTVFWSVLGALPVQHSLKMKVVHHATLQHLNPLQATLRYFGLSLIVMFISVIPLTAPVLIFFVLHFASKDKFKRALHDHLAKSMVIDVSPNAQATPTEQSDDDTTGRAF